MYPWIWQHLPGPVWLRLLTAVALLLAAVWVCFEWVFPALAPYMPFNDNTVGE